MTEVGPQEELDLDIPPSAYQRAFVRSIATTVVQFARDLATFHQRNVQRTRFRHQLPASKK